MARWASRRSTAHAGVYQAVLAGRAAWHADAVERLGGGCRPLPPWPIGQSIEVHAWHLPPAVRRRFDIGSRVLVHPDDHLEVVTVERADESTPPVVELAPRRGPQG